MAETLASRVGRIVSGSLHALVSAVEDLAPDTVMEQAIQEVDAAVDDVRAELGKLLAKKHLASTRLMEENRTLLRLKELETLEKVTEKIDKLTVYGGLEGVLNDVVRIAEPEA